MTTILGCAALVLLCIFLVVVAFSLLVLTEIVRAEEVRRWFKRKKGE